MESKFKPRIPARGKATRASNMKVESPSPAAPAAATNAASAAAPIDAKREGDDDMALDLKPEPMDFMFDDMDVKVKLEGDSVVWEGMDEKQEPKPEASASHTVHKEKKVDRVVREIDVYLSPAIDSDTKFYLLQYPLRPYWRPYDLEERCEEVRVKQQHNKLEVDLVVDNFGENYDHGADEHLQITKQTLTSTQGNLSTSYTIGILQGNKLHLNPLHAIVQLRPSLKYINEADEKKKKNITHIDSDEEMPDADELKDEETEAKPQRVALKVEIKKQETERQQQSRLMSYAHLKQLEDAEPWISLEPHGFDSPITEEIRDKMKASGIDDISFNLNPKEYFKKLVPGRAVSSATKPIPQLGKEPLSMSYLDTLPLEKRLRAILSGAQVHVLQFERLMKLVPSDCTEEAVLDVLQTSAYLVQGCWVATSAMRYSNNGPKSVIRDFILLQFVNDRVVSRETLEQLNLSKDDLREILLPLAVQNIRTGGWEFIESTDKSFIKRHNLIYKDQLQRWKQAEKVIQTKAFAVPFMKGGIGAASTSSAAAANAIRPSSSSMAPETLASLPVALREIFLKHHVCNLQFLCNCLREMAITKSQADIPVQEKACAVAAAKGASAPMTELSAIVDTVATNINGVYFLTQLGDPSVDPFREVVIALLKQKPVGLQRSEVMETSKLALKKAIPNPLYQKVMKELCYTRGATWVLKTGDGRPS